MPLRAAARTSTAPWKRPAAALEGAWARATPAQRARLLIRLADLIERDGELIALTETLDNGMPFMMAKFAAVLGASEQLRYNAGWATKITGETVEPSSPGEWHCFTLREPVGVVGAIVPWELPLRDGGRQDRSRARGRLHGRAQARRADAAFGRVPREAGGRGWLSGGRPSTS